MGKPAGYVSDLLARAQKQYPFVTQYQPVVTMGKRQGDYAETWPIGETGDAQYPRPNDIPLDRTGVEVFKPSQFGPSDLAAEFLHVDPFANATRGIFGRGMSPAQMATLRRESGDYQQSMQMGLGQEKANANAVDSAMRGYTVGQWPADANARMQYTPDQTQLLNHLRQYMQQGYYPSNFNLSRGR